MAISLLDALEAPYPRNANEKQLTGLVTHQLRGQGVRVAVLDEAQNFVDQESCTFSYKVAEWLKGLLNEGACAFVFAGMPASRAIYDLTEQIDRRSAGSVELADFSCLQPDDMQAFRQILQHLLNKSPLPVDPSLTASDLGLAFHAVSRGRIGMLVDFIAKACIFALGDGSDSLGINDLVEAAFKLRPSGDPAWRNPFSLPHGQLQDEVERLEEGRKTGALRLNLRRGKRKRRVSDVLVH